MLSRSVPRHGATNNITRVAWTRSLCSLVEESSLDVVSLSGWKYCRMDGKSGAHANPKKPEAANHLSNKSNGQGRITRQQTKRVKRRTRRTKINQIKRRGLIGWNGRNYNKKHIMHKALNDGFSSALTLAWSLEGRSNVRSKFGDGQNVSYSYGLTRQDKWWTLGAAIRVCAGCRFLPADLVSLASPEASGTGHYACSVIDRLMMIEGYTFHKAVDRLSLRGWHENVIPVVVLFTTNVLVSYPKLLLLDKQQQTKPMLLLPNMN